MVHTGWVKSFLGSRAPLAHVPCARSVSHCGQEQRCPTSRDRGPLRSPSCCPLRRKLRGKESSELPRLEGANPAPHAWAELTATPRAAPGADALHSFPDAKRGQGAPGTVVPWALGHIWRSQQLPPVSSGLLTGPRSSQGGVLSPMSSMFSIKVM